MRIGVSACLLGQAVRWDGRDKRHDVIIAMLGQAAELVAVCPEVEAGLGVPREPMQLERRGAALHLVGRESGRELGERLRTFAQTRVAALAALGLSGYVLKSRSPSCGLDAVPVFAPSGAALDEGGRGLFAAALLAALPELPVVEETALTDAEACARFVARARAYRAT